MQSYLSDRVLLYDTTEGRRAKVVTAGAAQDSVLGPDIWNNDYDGILGLTGLPEGASLVGYADDIVLVIIVRSLARHGYEAYTQLAPGAQSTTRHAQIRDSTNHAEEDRHNCAGENRRRDYRDKEGGKVLRAMARS